jgi:hypothetical protein
VSTTKVFQRVFIIVDTLFKLPGHMIMKKRAQLTGLNALHSKNSDDLNTY